MSNLVLTVGIVGSGKSTHSKPWAKSNGCLYLSSDELRGHYGLSESDQSVTPQVFRHIQIQVEICLAQNLDCLVDATNINRKWRAGYLEIAKKYSANVTAFVFQTPLEVCLDRNRKRARVVPEEVIGRMHSNFEAPRIEEIPSIQIFNYKESL